MGGHGNQGGGTPSGHKHRGNNIQHRPRYPKHKKIQIMHDAENIDSENSEFDWIQSMMEKVNHGEVVQFDTKVSNVMAAAAAAVPPTGSSRGGHGGRGGKGGRNHGSDTHVFLEKETKTVYVNGQRKVKSDWDEEDEVLNDYVRNIAQNADEEEGDLENAANAANGETGNLGEKDPEIGRGSKSSSDDSDDNEDDDSDDEYIDILHEELDSEDLDDLDMELAEIDEDDFVDAFNETYGSNGKRYRRRNGRQSISAHVDREYDFAFIQMSKSSRNAKEARRLTGQGTPPKGSSDYLRVMDALQINVASRFEPLAQIGNEDEPSDVDIMDEQVPAELMNVLHEVIAFAADKKRTRQDIRFGLMGNLARKSVHFVAKRCNLTSYSHDLYLPGGAMGRVPVVQYNTFVGSNPISDEELHSILANLRLDEGSKPFYDPCWSIGDRALEADDPKVRVRKKQLESQKKKAANQQAKARKGNKKVQSFGGEEEDELEEDVFVPSRYTSKPKPSKGSKRDSVAPGSSGSKKKAPSALHHVMHKEVEQSSAGHKMLLAMGWQQGSGLGATKDGITKPISVEVRESRRGLG